MEPKIRPHRLSHLLTILGAALTTCATCATELRAAVTLAPPFSDHAVLQRGRPIRVWGTAEGGTTVEVALAGVKMSAKAGADGAFEVELPAMDAGGPHVLTASSGDANVSIADVAIGDVWVCAGQSNMQWTLSQIDGGQAAIERAGDVKNVRLLQLPKSPAQEPTTKLDAKWQPASPESAASFSGVGFLFARALRTDSSLDSVPIGLIDNSFGGTAAEAWISAETLARQYKPTDLLESIFGIKPSQMYNGMVVPIVRFPVKGVLWYQGESNVRNSGLYARMLTSMIEEWRNKWGQPELPFLVVQLPNFPGGKNIETYAWIREAQAKVAASVKNVFLATSIDTPDGMDIHPRHKSHVAHRLALLARKHIYGRDVIASGPVFSRAEVESGRIRVHFEASPSKLVNKNFPAELRGFMVAGEDRRYHYARATIDGDSVLVDCPLVEKPQTVRYAWVSYPDADLFNSDGLPAAPFRTDAFEPEFPIELNRMPPERKLHADRYDASVSGSGVLSSLFVDGQQVLSNDGPGGLTVDGFFSARTLYFATDRSPSEVEYTDGAVLVRYTFSGDEIVVRVDNAYKDETRAHLHLTNGTKVTAVEGTPGAFIAERNGVKLDVTGADETTPSGSGTRLSTKLAAHEVKTVRIKVASPPPAPPAK